MTYQEVNGYDKISRAKSAWCIVDFVKQTVDLKKSGSDWKGLCPFHQEKTPSFTVSQKRQSFRCFGCGAHGDLIDFVAMIQSIRKSQAADFILDGKGMSKSLMPITSKPSDIIWPAIDWERFRLQFWYCHCLWLSQWRGYSLEFCRWMRSKGHIGMHKDCVAFPIYQGIRVVRLHCRSRNSSKWFYYPLETRAHTTVMRIGGGSSIAHLFESQWDMLAALDQSNQWRDDVMDSWIATRGACNSNKLSGLAFEQLFAYPQNDATDKKSGNGKWQPDILHYFPNAIICKTPGKYKDFNDAARDGINIYSVNPLMQKGVE